METIVKRIRDVARDLEMGEGNFEQSIGVSVGYLNITAKRNGDPGVSLVKNITELYPEYSIEWIITGDGPMKLPSPMILNEDASVYNTEASKFQKSMIALLDKMIDAKINPKIEAINDSLMRLIKRNMIEMEAKESEKAG